MAAGRALSGLGKHALEGLIEHAKALGVVLPSDAEDSGTEPTRETLTEVLRALSKNYFPALSPTRTPK